MRFDFHDSYGYPVLRPENDDYVNCAIQSSLAAVTDADLSNVMVSYQIAISAPEINELIAQKKARIVLYGECRDTWFDTLHYPEKLEDSFTVPKEDIDGEFVVTCLIIASEDIVNFRSVKFNPEYGDASFNIAKGEIIAYDLPQSFYISREVFRNVTSLFDYSESTNLAVGEWDVDLEEDRIKVEVHPAQLPMLRTAEGTAISRSVLLSGLFLPVLIHILNEMKQDGSGYDERKWFKVIDAKKSSMPVSVAKSLVRFSQALLKQPLMRLNKTMGWNDES